MTIELPALYLFAAIFLSTQIILFLTVRASFSHVIDHLHDLLTVMAPIRISLPQIKAAYDDGFKAGILEQTRRQNEELHPGEPEPPTPIKPTHDEQAA